jgi:uncharacterized membrane protein
MLNFDSNLTNSLIHLYRGELGRMVSYRVRLDTTTNWSIVTNAAITTVALGNPQIPHTIFLYAIFITFFFLQLEARRFRVFEISHYRVRILEKFFYRDMLQQAMKEDWQAELLSHLRHPSSPIGWYAAMGWRIRRNYLWLYSGLFLTWVIKLETSPSPSEQPVRFVAKAAIGSISGWIVLGMFVLLYAGLVFWALTTKRHPLDVD